MLQQELQAKLEQKDHPYKDVISTKWAQLKNQLNKNVMRHNWSSHTHDHMGGQTNLQSSDGLYSIVQINSYVCFFNKQSICQIV